MFPLPSLLLRSSPLPRLPEEATVAEQSQLPSVGLQAELRLCGVFLEMVVVLLHSVPLQGATTGRLLCPRQSHDLAGVVTRGGLSWPSGVRSVSVIDLATCTREQTKAVFKVLSSLSRRFYS